MLNRKEMAVLKRAIKEITGKKVNRNYWMEDDQRYTCFGMEYFFLRLRTEDVPEELSLPASLKKGKILDPIKEIIEADYTEAEDTELLQKSGKDLIKVINRYPDEGLNYVYVNNKFDFGLEDYLISVESDNQKNYPMTVYEKGGLQIYILPIRVGEKNKFLK